MTEIEDLDDDRTDGDDKDDSAGGAEEIQRPDVMLSLARSGDNNTSGKDPGSNAEAQPEDTRSVADSKNIFADLVVHRFLESSSSTRHRRSRAPSRRRGSLDEVPVRRTRSRSRSRGNPSPAPGTDADYELERICNELTAYKDRIIENSTERGGVRA